MKEKVLAVIKTELFMKLFFIPSGLCFLVSLMEVIDTRLNSSSYVWRDFVVNNLSFIIPWFIISFIIALISKIRSDKYPEKVKLKNERINDNNVKLIVKCFRRAKFPFIMSVICFFIGLFFVVYTSYDILKVRLLISLIGYIPCILFIIITLLISKFYKRKKFKFFLEFITALLTLFLLTYYFLLIFICGLTKAENPITDIKKYEKIVNGDVLLKAFPKEIPNDVENIEFYYAPGFFQGGTNYSLYYIDKNMTIEEFDNKYKNRAIWIGKKEEHSGKDFSLGEVFSFAPVKEEDENNYVIYLIDGSCDDSGWCNHGDYLLAAYNEKTNEVLYRANSW